MIPLKEREEFTQKLIMQARQTGQLELNLSNLGLPRIPQEVFDLENLRVLKFMNNSLTKIPSQLAEMRNLRQLYLYNNQIQGVEEQLLLELPFLDVFDLAGNPFDYHSTSQFYYKHNPWKGFTKCVDDIRRTKDREDQSFYYFEELQVVPEQLYELDKIKYLSFHTKNITELPAGIKGLHNLQYLDLSGNQLSHLPTDIRELKNLHTVVLDRNNFSAFPEILLDVPNIRSISINDNHLTYLDLEILTDKRLTGFYAMNNPLENINHEVFQLGLEEVRKRLRLRADEE